MDRIILNCCMGGWWYNRAYIELYRSYKRPPIVKPPPKPPVQKPVAHKPTPLVTMWQQSRGAIADAATPLLAGFKTLWLILLSPVKFFRAQLQGTLSSAKLWTPFDPFWRTLTTAVRSPLEPAQLLLFGILTKTLVEQDLETGTEVGVQTGIEAVAEAQASANLSVNLSAENAETITELIKDSIEAGVQLANVDQIRETISNAEVQIASNIPEQLSDQASSQLNSLQELVDSAVRRGADIVDVQTMLELPANELAKVNALIQTGIEAGVAAGVEVNTVINQSQGLLGTVVGGALQSLPPVLNQQIAVMQQSYNRLIAPFMDQVLISALLDLMGHLLVVVFFAYLFRLLIGRALSAAQSYTFWLYLEALNIFSVAGYFAVLHFWPGSMLQVQNWISSLLQGIFKSDLLAALFASPAVNALGLAPDMAAFWFLESGLHTLFWLYLLPAIVLPKIFPELTTRRVFWTTIIGKFALLLLSALALFGLITVHLPGGVGTL